MEKGSKCTECRLDRADLGWVIKVNPSSEDSWGRHGPLTCCVVKGTVPLGSSSPKVQPQSNHEKKPRRIPLGTLPNTSPGYQ